MGIIYDENGTEMIKLFKNNVYVFLFGLITLLNAPMFSNTSDELDNNQPQEQTKPSVSNIVELRALDKTTGEVKTLKVPIGEVYIFHRLKIIVRHCWRSPPFSLPETKAFLEIFETTPSGRLKAVFSGWMFSSSPSISAMQHPVYDIWIQNTE